MATSLPQSGRALPERNECRGSTSFRSFFLVMEFSPNDYQVWIAKLERSIGRKTSLLGAVRYVSGLMDRGLPPIFDFHHLAGLLGIKAQTLSFFIYSTPNFYRKFSIPKRSGGVREISVPYPALIETQRWILKNILEVIPPDEAAHGFVKGHSIVSFAEKHAGKNAMLHIDIKNFFPSITFRQIYSIFSSVGYAPNVSFYLARLCAFEDALPQGAVTSPHLSNLVARTLDRRLHALASSLSLEYSRYADNMVFSGSGIPLVLRDLISGILKDEGFGINESKSYLSTGRGKRVVVGVSIANKELKLPKKTKRRIRQEAFHLITKGFHTHTKMNGIFDPIYVERLIGRLSFWVFVEPNNQYASNLLARIKDVKRQLGYQG